VEEGKEGKKEEEREDRKERDFSKLRIKRKSI